MGVKSGLKDVGRVLNIDFNTMNNITKKIDDITDKAPSIKFKNLDALKDGDDREKAKYAEFSELENKNKEVFRLARAFEGTKRNFSVHASGVLCMPMAINTYFPTRTVDGSQISLFTGPQTESCGGVNLQ